MAGRFEPVGPLRGRLRPPPDKSISHRAAILAAMDDGRTVVSGFLDAADTNSTLAAVEALGARVESGGGAAGRKEVSIEGVGLRGARDAAIDVGNAGTLLRILPGWLAGQETGSWILDGDDSIRRRPVDRIAAPLRRMGAVVSCREGRLPPLRVEGSPLRGIEYEPPVASAQVKSCLLLAGLLAEGETVVREPWPSRDHSERMLRAAGANIGWVRGKVRVRASETLQLPDIRIPGDLSSAAFFLVAATLIPGSDLVIEGVGLNPTRTGLLRILERMEAAIETEEEGVCGGEPHGRIRVRSAELGGTTVGAEEVPLAIDELPLVALAGCFAEGETSISGAGELRHKESDRIATVVEAIRALGGEAEPTADGMVVSGGGGLGGGRIRAHGDHRLAMVGAIAGLASRDGVEVDGIEAAAVSYPGFVETVGALSGQRP